MIPIPSGVRVWLATGHTDMRCGFPSLALRVQEVLKRNPMDGGLFCFRGKRGDLLKIIGMMVREHLQNDSKEEDSSGLRLPVKR